MNYDKYFRKVDVWFKKARLRIPGLSVILDHRGDIVRVDIEYKDRRMVSVVDLWKYDHLRPEIIDFAIERDCEQILDDIIRDDT